MQSAGIATPIKSSGTRKMIAVRNVSRLFSRSLGGRSKSWSSGGSIWHVCCITPLLLSFFRKCGSRPTWCSIRRGRALQKSERACNVFPIRSSSFSSALPLPRCSSSCSRVSIICATSRSHTFSTTAISLLGLLASGNSSSRLSSCCSHPFRWAVVPAAATTPTICSHRAATSSRASLSVSDAGGENHSSWNVLITSLWTSSSSVTRLTSRQHMSTARAPVGSFASRSRRILITRFLTEIPGSLSRFTMVS
mmetsp:Transcript_40068/g.90831  ORF Transcript_40068/g.90831 Transcript_40068/m.90831 type:complete len:251 (-) Transcript_40068:135-887(-)